LVITVAFIHFTRVSPPVECHPAPFLPVQARLSTTLCKFSHIFFVQVSPLQDVTRGGPPHPAPLPSDATAVTSGELNTKEIAEYSDFGPIERYISRWSLAEFMHESIVFCSACKMSS